MTLLEIITLQVAPAIAKAILKLWLKDSAIATDLSSTVVDIIRTKTEDTIAQQRARRQFEEIGESVAEQLLEVIQFEGEKLDEGSREAIALAVASTFAATSIDPQLLLERDLDPEKLASHLIQAYPPATLHFSETERTLYARVIAETCEYVVDIASRLPAFHERSFAEVLRRQSYLVESANQVLEEFQRLRQAATPPEAGEGHARFEQEYRRAVIRNLDELELFGVSLSTPASRRHQLSVAYITLSVGSIESQPSNEVAAIRQADPGEPDDEEGETREFFRSVDEVLAQSHRLLLKGDAGSGKTTLLQWIAVRSASRDFQGLLAEWNDTVPFFIRLRQLERGLPSPEQFPALVSPAVSGAMPPGWVHDQLGSGRALVLIDGIDEVPESNRTQVRQWLKDLVGAYGESRFVVSSRPYAIDAAWQDLEGFGEAYLQPMELPDIYAFIDHWHSAVQHELAEGGESENLEEVAENLKQVVRSTRAIRNLASTPVLCAMLCALHRDRRQHLPADRIELYEAGCQMLLERRDLERRIELRDYPNLSYRQKLALLQDLAYYLLVNGWSMAQAERVDERLALKLEDMANLPPEASGMSVRRLFTERSGLLRQPVPGNIDFAHRTFQEFLAAHAVLHEGNIGLLLNNAHDDQWQEVAILAAGIASLVNSQVCEEIISGLLRRGDHEPQKRHQLHLLAAACLETSPSLDKKIKGAVQLRLRRIIPGNVSEARAIAAAGELAIPHLALEKGYGWNRATVAAACVRALSLIGGEAALAALETYGSDRRQRVRLELLRAWDAFDRHEYASRILAVMCRQSRQFEISHAPFLYSLEGLQEVPKLETLALINCRRISDLGPVSGLTGLVSLTLKACPLVHDLMPLQELHDLTLLELNSMNWHLDLDVLAQLPKLTSLHLSSGVFLRPLGKIASLLHLRVVSFMNTQGLTWLSELHNLHSLELISLRDLSDLEALSSLTNLESLTLARLPRVSDLTPLRDVKSLREIYWYDMPKDAIIPEEISNLITTGPRPALR